MASFSIEPAAPAAQSACLALLPELASPDTLLFSARDQSGRLAGAGGILWRSWGREGGLPGWINVLPDCRGAGAGRLLLAALAGPAQAEGARLVAFHPLDEGGAEAAFSRHCGGVVLNRHFYFDGDPRESFLPSMERIVAGLERRGSIPPEARIIPLSEAPLDEVKWLLAREMATAPPQVEQMLEAGRTGSPETAPVDFTQSCVLMVGEEVAGAVLAKQLERRDSINIVVNVIAPAWRRGWANALLAQRFTRQAVDRGVTRITADCGEDVRDSMGLAQRGRADQVAIKVRYAYAARAS